jgi:predicted cupin superfamily sugar epimerase
MRVDELIRVLNLQSHPRENGFFRETYRSTDSTAIYFLLKADGFSEMHRLQFDEIFHFYAGAPAELLLLKPDGSGEIIRIGNRIEAGEIPQVVVPRNCWQGMRSIGEFTLLGTTVAPPFEYAHYQSGNREELIQQYQSFAELIRKLT